MLKSYLKKVSEVANRGDPREESYYSVLQRLLEEYSESISKKGIHVTTLPKKTKQVILILGYGMEINI